jgi:DNA-3-methyladenine glycosylase I
MNESIIRCKWCESSDLMKKYHDTEWGVPLHDDDKLFEFIVLDSFQAGLSWATIINKRENFKKAFVGFDANKIALFDALDKERLMNDVGIIRNKLKINATIGNAIAFLKTKEEFGTFDRYIWQFVNHKTINNNIKQNSEVPTKTTESDAMSKDLQKRGFKFVGTTICYAFMQAAGMINDHHINCFRHEKVYDLNMYL